MKPSINRHLFIVCVEEGLYGEADVTIDPDGEWSVIFYEMREPMPMVAFGDKNTPASELLAGLFQGKEIAR